MMDRSDSPRGCVSAGGRDGGEHSPPPARAKLLRAEVAADDDGGGGDVCASTPSHVGKIPSQAPTQ